MNSSHKVVRSIRNTTLNLCADCAKQFVRNAQNCGKTNQGFCAMITHQLTHRCLCMTFLTKNKTVIISQPPYSPDQASADFFLFSKLKTPMKGKCFATIEEIKEKSKQELLAIPKSAFHKWFEDRKKRWQKCIIFEGGYFEGNKIIIDK